MAVQPNEESKRSDGVNVSFGRFRLASPPLEAPEYGRRKDDAEAKTNDEQNNKSQVESAPLDVKQIEEVKVEEEEDAFFAKSFASDESDSESEISDAFVGGLRNLFDSEETDEECDSESTVEELSESERFQRTTELERREAIDAAVLQNDADFLYEAREKYERSRVEQIEEKDAPNLGEGNNRTQETSPNENGNGNENASRVPIRTENVLEAMLFVGDRDNKPLTLARACELMRDVTETEALETLADLNERYFREGAPYKIVCQGDGYVMTLRQEFADVAARFGGKTKEFKLTQAAIDVLALVAYRQPITLDEIIEVRNNASGVLTQLVKRDLISVEKKTLDNKKISYYKTTERFLKIFGLSSLDDLPIVGDVNYR